MANPAPFPSPAAAPKPTGPAEARPPAAAPVQPAGPDKASKEVGGRKGPDPTRYGDWELKGRCIDF